MSDAYIIEQTQESQTSKNSVMESIGKSTSIDSLNSSALNVSTMCPKHRIQIDREGFLDLCEKYRPFRKLLLPISYFYEDNFTY